MVHTPFQLYIKELRHYQHLKTYESSLGLTVEEFTEKWNKLSIGYGSNLELKDIQIIENNILNIKINKNIGFIGNIDPDSNYLSNINMIGSGDGTPKSGANIISSIAIMLSVFTDDEEVDVRNKALHDLGLIDLENTDLNTSIILKGLKFSLRMSKEIGISFSVSR
ncbi:hypothetical protein [Priestia megaterium]|uniref:hypothetical protein n=1 Tax=Priestia megaterium TaxID=1404 RepID=UPI00301C29A3